MYRHRNRPKYTEEELGEVYSRQYDHTRWDDHIARVAKTVELGKQMVCYDEGPCLADLSCGDGAIVSGINPWACHQLGDFTPGHEYHGPIEETILQLDHSVDLFVCSETIEHLDDPDAVLRQIREASAMLLLSTPKLSWPDPNPEHYWAWDSEAVCAMLIAAGWDPIDYVEQYSGLGYTYQIWGCL